VLGSVYGLHHLLAPQGWVAWLVGILGGAASLAAGVWLFLPVAVVIAYAFMEPVCRAVERRWYPDLPPPRGASLVSQIWDGLVVGCLVLGMNVVALLLAVLIPGIGLLLGWAITAWALGRGLFVAVAMRRMTRMDAARLYLSHRGGVLLQGGALSLAASIPLLNLFLPVLGPACMVHVLMQRVPAA
jgi:CysZ protein